MKILEAIRQGMPVPVPVIDTHTHLGEYALGGMHQGFQDMAAAIADAGAAGVDCVITSPSPLSFGDMELTNAVTAELIQAFLGKVYGNLFLAPHNGAKAVEKTIEKYASARGFVGIKLLTGNHGTLHQPAFEPVWEFAESVQCPVACHMASKSPGRETVVQVLEKHPDVKLLLSHLGGKKADIPFYASLMKDSKVYLDTSGRMPADFAEVVRLCGEDRLIFGSDFVTRDVRAEIGKIVISGVSDEALKKIFSENYLRLLEDSRYGKIKL